MPVIDSCALPADADRSRRGVGRRVMARMLAVLVTVTGGVLVFSPAAHALLCQTNELSLSPPPGRYQCGYRPLLIEWPDGHMQYFVVGINNSVYDEWPVYDSYQMGPDSLHWSPWRNLGGNARSPVDCTYISWTSIGLSVLGTDGRTYFKGWSADGDWYPSQTTWTSESSSFGPRCLNRSTQ